MLQLIRRLLLGVAGVALVVVLLAGWTVAMAIGALRSADRPGGPVNQLWCVAWAAVPVVALIATWLVWFLRTAPRTTTRDQGADDDDKSPPPTAPAP